MRNTIEQHAMPWRNGSLIKIAQSTSLTSDSCDAPITVREVASRTIHFVLLCIRSEGPRLSILKPRLVRGLPQLSASHTVFLLALIAWYRGS